MNEWINKEGEQKVGGCNGGIGNALIIAFSSLKNNIYKSNRQTQIHIMWWIVEIYLDTKKINDQQLS